MRIPRSVQLCEESGIVHKYWRAHNRECLLDSNKVKLLYLQAIIKGIAHRVVEGKVKLYAYCVMSNHAHEVVGYENKSCMLSLFMKIAHSWFGYMFNRLTGREGTFLSGRTKTPQIQKIEKYTMNTHFYVEANPLRAGITNDLKLYPFSSNRFYSWGIVDDFSKHLTAPSWYLELGSTANQRQARYRALFNKYLKNSAPLKGSLVGYYIGSSSWVDEQTLRISGYLQMIRQNLLKVPLQDGAPIEQQFF